MFNCVTPFLGLPGAGTVVVSRGIERVRKSRHAILVRLLLGSAAAACLAHPALAQQAAPGPVRLPGLSVEGQGTAIGSGIGPVDGYVAKDTTTGSKTDIPVTEVPQTVNVIGRDEMYDRGITTKIDEALRYTPGVTAAPYGVDPDTDWFYIRGFQATQTGVFLDGLNLFSYGFGGFQMDAFFMERVEVLKGPASVLYGGSNPGGIVDMIRLRPDDKRRIYTEVGINNFGNAYAAFDVGNRLNANWKYRVTGKIAGGDQYEDYAKDFRGAIMPQVTWEPSAATSVTGFVYYSGLNQTHTSNGFLPYNGTVVSAPFGKLRQKNFYGEPSVDTGRYNQTMVGYEARHTLDSGWTLSQNARYGHLYKYEAGPYPYGYIGGAPTPPAYNLNRIGFDAKSRVNTFNIDNKVDGKFATGFLGHSVLAGLDYKYYTLDHVQACCGSTPISATNPVYGAPQGANFVYLDQDLTQQQIGIYIQDQIRFADRFLLTLNGRQDWVKTDSDARVGTTYKSNDSALSGRAGLAYEFPNGVTPYVSAATFFNPVIGVNPTLSGFKPEEGTQYEGGIKYAPTFVDGLFTASVFQITKKNAVTSIPGTFLSDQLGEVRSRGFELEGKVNITPNFKLLGGYSYTDLEVTKDPNQALVGKTPFIVPKQAASAWVDYTFSDGFARGLGLGAGVRYQGESWADAMNTLKVPAATVADAAIRYQVADWNASLNFTNIFNKTYVKSCGGADVCGWAEPRTVMLRLGKSW